MDPSGGGAGRDGGRMPAAQVAVEWSGREGKGRKSAAAGRSSRGGGSDHGGQGWGCPWPRPVAATFAATAAVSRERIGRGSCGGLIDAMKKTARSVRRERHHSFSFRLC